MKRIFLSIITSLFLAINAFGLEKVRYIRAIDGDTIKAEYEGKEQSVRLIGIDTPESRFNKKLFKDCQKEGRKPKDVVKEGKRAASFVKEKLKNKEYVWLEFDKRKNDQYGRLLAYIYIEDVEELEFMLNYMLLKEGYATVLRYAPNMKYKAEFQEAQEKAKRSKSGFWSNKKR